MDPETGCGLPSTGEKARLLISRAHWFWNSIGPISAAAAKGTSMSQQPEITYIKWLLLLGGQLDTESIPSVVNDKGSQASIVFRYILKHSEKSLPHPVYNLIWRLKLQFEIAPFEVAKRKRFRLLIKISEDLECITDFFSRSIKRRMGSFSFEFVLPATFSGLFRHFLEVEMAKLSLKKLWEVHS